MRPKTGLFLLLAAAGTLAAGCSGGALPRYAIYAPEPRVADARGRISLAKRETLLAETDGKKGRLVVAADARRLLTTAGERLTVVTAGFVFVNRTGEAVVFDPAAVRLTGLPGQSFAPKRTWRDGEEGGVNEVAPGHRAEFLVRFHLPEETIAKLGSFKLSYSYTLGGKTHERETGFRHVRFFSRLPAPGRETAGVSGASLSVGYYGGVGLYRQVYIGGLWYGPGFYYGWYSPVVYTRYRAYSASGHHHHRPAAPGPAPIHRPAAPAPIHRPAAPAPAPIHRPSFK